MPANPNLPNGPDLTLSTSFTYNEDGLVQMAASSDHYGEVRTERMVYDVEEGIYPEIQVNAMGHMSRQKFHPALDVVVWAKNENGLEYRAKYDLFGNLHSFDGPSESGFEVTRFGAEGGRLVTRTTDNAGGYSEVWEDRAGRSVEERRPVHGRGAGAFDRFQTFYDAHGRPRLMITPDKVIRRRYDVLDRLTASELLNRQLFLDSDQIVVEATRQSEYPTVFDRLDTDELGRVTETTLDTLHQVVERLERRPASEGASLVAEYESLPHGLIERILFAGQETKVKYDALGRRTELQDPSTGLSTFEFNAFGEERVVSDSNVNPLRAA